jgi:hypothetical protein
MAAARHDWPRAMAHEGFSVQNLSTLWRTRVSRTAAADRPRNLLGASSAALSLRRVAMSVDRQSSAHTATARRQAKVLTISTFLLLAKPNTRFLMSVRNCDTEPYVNLSMSRATGVDNGAQRAATTFEPNSVGIVNRSANIAVFITDLAHRAILRKNILLRRDRDEKPQVSRRWHTFWRRLGRQSGQAIWAVPEAVQVRRGTASDAVARGIGHPGCGDRRCVHFIGIRNNSHRWLKDRAGGESRRIGFNRCLRHRRHR